MECHWLFHCKHKGREEPVMDIDYWLRQPVALNVRQTYKIVSSWYVWMENLKNSTLLCFSLPSAIDVSMFPQSGNIDTSIFWKSNFNHNPNPNHNPFFRKRVLCSVLK